MAVALAVVVLLPSVASGGQAVARPVESLPLAGSLDPSFGSGGVVPQSPGSAIALQPDGKIVLAADSSAGVMLARYLPNGSLDPSFGTGGQVQTGVGAGVFGALGALALQLDGKIVVAGSSNYGNTDQFTLARFDSNGSPDSSFGTGGVTNSVLPAEPGDPWGAGVAGLAVLPNGEILAAGSATWHQGMYEEVGGFVLARYTPSGSLDPTFGDGGIVENFDDGDADLAGIVVLPDGRIVATGTNYGGHPDYPREIALAGYEPDGSADFGYPPVTAGNLSGGPSTLQHGQIVVAGSIQQHKETFPLIARYRTNGLLDSTFGKHGYEQIRSLKDEVAEEAVATQPDGKILLTTGSAVVRLTPNGRLDPGFGHRGIETLPTGTDASGLALQPDGNILVGGSALMRLIGGNNCIVPSLRGTTVPKARATLKTFYCRSGRIAKQFSNNVTRGRVISTVPKSGSRLHGGATVKLVVSRGKHAVR